MKPIKLSSQVTLEESIRYKSGDPVEKWLHDLLCLEASLPPTPTAMPLPSQCQLFYVNRDTLFGYHKVRTSLCGDFFYLDFFFCFHFLVSWEYGHKFRKKTEISICRFIFIDLHHFIRQKASLHMHFHAISWNNIK